MSARGRIGAAVAALGYLRPGWGAVSAGLPLVLVTAAAGVVVGSAGEAGQAFAAARRYGPEALVVTASVAVAAGLLRRAGAETFARLARTRDELGGDGYPVVWVYAAAASAASFSVFAALADASAGAALAALACLATLAVAIRAAMSRDSGGEDAAGLSAIFPSQALRRESDDKFARDSVVRSLIGTINLFGKARPGIVSLEGGWGVGKSSVAAFAIERLRADGKIAESFSCSYAASTTSIADALAVTVEHALDRRWLTLDVGRAFAHYYQSLKLLADRGLPVSLPWLPEDGGAPRARLARLLAHVPKPIVIFLEDIDRMTGPDLLALLGATQVVGAVEGLVFVLVMDRAHCRAQLRHVVANPNEYLDKWVMASVRVPPVPDPVLLANFVDMVERASAARGVAFAVPDGAPDLHSLAPVWAGMFGNMRRVINMVNAYSVALDLVGEAVSPFDTLIATALSEIEPGVLDMVERNRASWLRGEARSAADEDGAASRRGALLRESLADEGHIDAAMTLAGVLFPDAADAESLERGHRIGHYRYFARYRELDAGL